MEEPRGFNGHAFCSTIEEVGDQRREQRLPRELCLGELDPIHHEEPRVGARERGLDLQCELLWLPKVVSVEERYQLSPSAPYARIA